MGSKNTKPIYPASDIINHSTPEFISTLREEFCRLANSQDPKNAKIGKYMFTENVLRERFESFGPTVMERIFSVCCFHGNDSIDYEEFLCCQYIFQRGNADDRYRFIFNLFDLDADSNLSKKEFKKISMALMQGNEVVNDSNIKLFSPMADLLFVLSLNHYSRGNDMLLRFSDWKMYAYEDAIIQSLFKSMQVLTERCPALHAAQRKYRSRSGSTKRS